MLTDGGIGIALFAPFDTRRYYLPWRPVVVSPLSLRPLFSAWGAAVALSELLWVWLPALLFALVASRLTRSQPTG